MTFNVRAEGFDVRPLGSLKQWDIRYAEFAAIDAAQSWESDPVACRRVWSSAVIRGLRCAAHWYTEFLAYDAVPRVH